jgi:hypothetical protein
VVVSVGVALAGLGGASPRIWGVRRRGFEVALGADRPGSSGSTQPASGINKISSRARTAEALIVLSFRVSRATCRYQTDVRAIRG